MTWTYKTNKDGGTVSQNVSPIFHGREGIVFEGVDPVTHTKFIVKTPNSEANVEKEVNILK